MRRMACALLYLSGLLSTGTAVSLDITAMARPHIKGEMIIQFEPGSSQGHMQAVIQKQGGHILHYFKTSPSVLAKFEDEQAVFSGMRESLESGDIVSGMPNFKIEFT